MDFIGGLSQVFDPADLWGVRGNRAMDKANGALDDAQATMANAAAQNEKLYGSCSTYRREGVRSKETRYDCGVCQTVGLLQQVAQKKRKCECEY